MDRDIVPAIGSIGVRGDESLYGGENSTLFNADKALQADGGLLMLYQDDK